MAEFRHELRANTIRLPINPSSVGTAWWRSYRGAIDASLDAGNKVILSYWEANNAKDGRVDDPQAFDAMWDTVVKAYAQEPARLLRADERAVRLLARRVGVAHLRHGSPATSDVPRRRVVISGTGYNDNVTGVGAARELDGTLLSLHFYGFWASDTTEAAWKANLQPRIGEYGWRTIIDEAGAPMTTGLNYGNHEGNVYTSYFGALTETAREQDMGIVYWPGLRDRRRVLDDDAGRATATSRSTARAGSPSCNGAGACSRTSRSTTFPPRPPARCCAVWPAAAASTFPASRRATEPRSTSGTATAAATSRGTGPLTSN